MPASSTVTRILGPNRGMGNPWTYLCSPTVGACHRAFAPPDEAELLDVYGVTDQAM